MLNTIFLSAPRYLLDTLSLLYSLSPDSANVAIGIKPSKWDAETTADFFSASIFPLEQFALFYDPYGPPIYELLTSSFRSKNLQLRLSERWIMRAQRSPYQSDPYLLNAAGTPFWSSLQNLFDAGPVWLQSKSPRPLDAENIADALLRTSTGSACLCILQAQAGQPLYRVLHLDDNGTITVQLDATWKANRNTAFITAAERADAFLDAHART